MGSGRVILTTRLQVKLSDTRLDLFTVRLHGAKLRLGLTWQLCTNVWTEIKIWSVVHPDYQTSPRAVVQVMSRRAVNAYKLINRAGPKPALLIFGHVAQ